MRRRSLLVVAPLVLLGAKCVDYDPALVGGAPPGDVEGSLGGGPRVACATPGEAHLRVEEFAFAIECGCVEAPWDDGATGSHTCTVPRGTKIIWHFSGSVEHNVHALTQAFSDSGNKTRGQFTATFPTTGGYVYGCSLHPAEMSGYRIDVLDPD